MARSDYPKHDKKFCARVIKLRGQGLTYRAIREQMGVSLKLIHTVLKENDPNYKHNARVNSSSAWDRGMKDL